jgi:hypothetical protein
MLNLIYTKKNRIENVSKDEQCKMLFDTCLISGIGAHLTAQNRKYVNFVQKLRSKKCLVLDRETHKYGKKISFSLKSMSLNENACCSQKYAPIVSVHLNV